MSRVGVVVFVVVGRLGWGDGRCGCLLYCSCVNNFLNDISLWPAEVPPLDDEKGYA